MRKSLWTSTLTAAVAAASVTTMWVVARAQPADTAVPAPTTAPVGGANAAGAATAPAPTTQEAMARASYYLGFQWGQSFKDQEFQVDMANLNAGLTDAVAGTPSRFSEEQLQQAVMQVRVMMMERERTKAAEASAKNKAEGTTFLEGNKTKPGVKTTASGLQYQITQEGNGPTPKPTDIVRVHYTGKLLNGTTFDSSVASGQPIEIALDRVVPGWAEGLQLFKVGSKGTLWIPASLGFGDQPAGDIPPGSTLVFDIDLLGIVPPSTQPAEGMIPGMPPTGAPAGGAPGGAQPALPTP